MNKSYEIAKLRRRQDDAILIGFKFPVNAYFLFESIFGLCFCFSCFSN